MLWVMVADVTGSSSRSPASPHRPNSMTFSAVNIPKSSLLIWEGRLHSHGSELPLAKGWNTLHDFGTDFCLNLESEGVISSSQSQQQSADFGQSELTDFEGNRIVYDGHRLESQSFSVRCPIFLCNHLQSRQVYDA